MSLNLPTVPGRYDPDGERDRNDALETADRKNLKRGENITVPNPQLLILQSPSGQYWAIEVDDLGVITAVAV